MDGQELVDREYAAPDLAIHRYGLGRQIFAPLRKDLLGAEQGASSIFTYVYESCMWFFHRIDNSTVDKGNVSKAGV